MAQLTDIQARSRRSSGSDGEARKSSSSHLDSSLKHFSDPSFDPVNFLNDTLPPLSRPSISTQLRATDDSRAVAIAELSTQTQTLLSQLNAQNSRLSNTLNQLTDEILRSGSRLAYEVEVLRGETIGLSDTLTETLQEDIRCFLPQGLPEPSPTSVQDAGPSSNPESEDEREKAASGTQETLETSSDPEYITRLRTLIQVRSKLEEVIQVFGEAMEWPLPPSEISIASSFISVSAPETGPESRSLEEKGREVAKKFRTQVTELLDSNGGGEAGLEAANRQVEKLRGLANIWKGTIEEKPRHKFVDSLSKLVDERRKLLDGQAQERDVKDSRRANASPSKQSRRSTSREKPESSNSGGGLFRNLQRLRDEIYLE